MALDAVQLLGFIAAACTSFAFLPQAIRAFRTRHTRDLSVWMLAATCAGVALWLAYGIMRDDVPLIVANVWTLTLSLSVLALKIKYG